MSSIYTKDMTAVQLSDFVRATFSAPRADRVMARTGNGASFLDAVKATIEPDKMERYEKRIMASYWFLEIERVTGGCIILLLDRLHYIRDRERLPVVVLGSYACTEGPGRTVRSVGLTHYRPKADPKHEVLTVLNPGHVFSYPHFPE